VHRIRKAFALMAVTGAALFGSAGVASADGAVAEGAAMGSPGVLSGNLIQAPIDIPVNVCRNSANVIGALHPAFGNHCSNGEGMEHNWQDSAQHGWDADQLVAQGQALNVLLGVAHREQTHGREAVGDREIREAHEHDRRSCRIGTPPVRSNSIA
jgi:hypothetical protein